jgi:hypothetical protein
MQVMLEHLLRRTVVFALVVGPFAVAACGASGDNASGFAGPQSTGSSSGSSSGSSGGSSTSSSGSSGTFGDGGTDATTDTGAPDASPPDAGQPPTNIVFLHASPSVESLRLCWNLQPGTAGQLPFPSDNEMPASNYPGIPVGGAVWLDKAIGAETIVGQTIYAVRAKPIEEIAPGASCADLIACSGPTSDCFAPKMDYWEVGSIQPGDLRAGATNIVAISGCLGADDSLASADRCGPTWNSATGNLHLDVVPVASAAAADDAGGQLTVQAAQLSPGLQSLEGDAGALITFGVQGDASLIAQLDQEGDLLPASPVAVFLPGGLAQYGQLGFGVDVQGAAAGGAGHLWMSLAQAQQLVSPAQDPSVYYAGGPYVVAVLGDPNAPHAFGSGDGGYDGKGLHVLVLPTAPQTPP